jgi:predicted nuclease of predicted toxin-antitoxin system
VRLLLDEMIPPQIARGLREARYDAQAIKWDRDDLLGISDVELIRTMAAEGRATVTNDIADFQAIHDYLLTSGEEHAGMIFTFDAAMPRTKQAIPRWIETLGRLLDEHRAPDALRNRIHHLP